MTNLYRPNQSKQVMCLRWEGQPVSFQCVSVRGNKMAENYDKLSDKTATKEANLNGELKS